MLRLSRYACDSTDPNYQLLNLDPEPQPHLHAQVDVHAAVLLCRVHQRLRRQVLLQELIGIALFQTT